ncbi:PLP-dependent transferase [Phanerochaete sordida]|uniref:PLP-dependent transferase n=1 Tax=Phanerochaete sordida TaxID=48140 RepID=A0A9P3G444_9APHY|nr:PLP-dependent transferase [Phanerochaete sordida]
MADTPHVKIGLWDYVGLTPPPFGHAMRQFWSFDPKYINLNHGSFGAPPTPVQGAANVLADIIEENPDKFFRIDWYPLLSKVRARLAAFLGARTEEIVLVNNATVAAGIVLRNFVWREGDVLVGATTTYKGVYKNMEHIHDTNPQLTIANFDLDFPKSNDEILKDFRAHLRALPRAKASQANPDPKVVCVLDSIVSNPGILMPWREMVKICREENVYSVVDAAHSIGQEVGLDLEAIQPDFWFSNCHKWLYAKRSCAVLYVPKRNQHIIRTGFPTSHQYNSDGSQVKSDWMSKPNTNGDDWAVPFSWPGTMDFVPYLSINAALDFRQWAGGEEAINTYCRDLAREGGQRAAEILGTRVIDESGDGAQTLNMVNVELPLRDVPANKLDFANDVLRDRLLLEHQAYASHFYHNKAFWVRFSAQIYNELSDFEKMAEVFLKVCEEIKQAIREDVKSSPQS